MGVEKWIDAQLHPERIPDSRIDSLMSKYAVYSMSMGDVIRDYGVVQQLQRQVKKEAGADTSMDKRDARREVLTQDPKVTEVVRQTQQFVGEIQSASWRGRSIANDN